MLTTTKVVNYCKTLIYKEKFLYQHFLFKTTANEFLLWGCWVTNWNINNLWQTYLEEGKGLLSGWKGIKIYLQIFKNLGRSQKWATWNLPNYDMPNSSICRRQKSKLRLAKKFLLFWRFFSFLYYKKCQMCDFPNDDLPQRLTTCNDHSTEMNGRAKVC